MDVLNPTPALALPQAMWLTYRTIMERPDSTQDDIFRFVVPEAMRSRTPSDGAHFKRALAALREFEMVRSDPDGVLCTAEQVADAQGFIRTMRRRIVAPPESFGLGFKGAPDLRSGLVWLMRQSPITPLDFETNVQVSMPAGLFTNDTRWNAFRQWGVGLGFGLPALTALSTGAGQKATGAKVVANPTSAVIDAIKHPFGERLPRGELIPISRLLAFLQAELPVLPGHVSATYPGLKDNETNDLRALGLALSSAEERRVLVMEYQSDPTGVMALPDAQDYRHDRYVSAVTIKELYDRLRELRLLVVRKRHGDGPNRGGNAL